MAETTLPATPGRLRLSPGWLLFAALALAIPVAPLLVKQKPAALPDLGRLPPFSLTDERGRPFEDVERRMLHAAIVYGAAYTARCEHSDRQTGVAPVPGETMTSFLGERAESLLSLPARAP